MKPIPIYDFGDRLHAAFPSQVLMDITEVCNLACVHCPHPTFKQSEHYAARYLDPALNDKMVDEVARHGVGHTQYIRYASNGEPLVHPEGYDMIEQAVRHSGVFVSLTTNGTIMNEKRTQRLLQAGVHMIDISIDALHAPTYAKIRVGGDLTVTRTNVLRLLDWVRQGRGDTQVVVSFVEQAANRAETADFERYWRDQGVASVIIRRQHSCSGAMQDLASQARQGQNGLARRPCLYPWERVCINARADLAFCPSDWVHGSRVADYHHSTIHETWQGSFYQALRQAHVSSDYSQHKFCGQCPDWASTRWPREGRSYADLVGELIHDRRAPAATTAP